MKNRKGFHHITDKDRDRIHALYGHCHTQKDIARVLGVDPSSISREMRRYPRRTWKYCATRAQKDAEEKRSHSKRPGMKIADNPALRKHVIRELKKLRSPDEIAGRMKLEGATPCVGKSAIYKWLYSDDGKAYCKHLCTRRTRKKRQSRLMKRVLIPHRISHRDRPKEPGVIHSEGDLFVSPAKSGSKVCGLLVVEKESKLYSGSIVPNKSARVIVPAMREATTAVAADTCTLDNGIENIVHEKFGVDTYFCDPGTPTQKPDVEGSIGLIRRWFIPKGTILDRVPDATYRAQLHLLNGKYRKSLGYRSSYEYALERGMISRVPRISLSKAIAFR
jgi:IS30 family transposase